MTGTDLTNLSNLINTPSMDFSQNGASYKPLRNRNTDEDASDFTMVMTAKISTSVQEISAKQNGDNNISVTASSRTVRAEVFSISSRNRNTSIQNQNPNSQGVSAAANKTAGNENTVSLSKEDLEKAGKALDDFKTGVNDVLKNELGVTDEDIKDAMETLGLSYLDLTDVNKLSQLIMQLLGNDFSAADLLSLQNFGDIKNQINDLAQDLFDTTGMTGQQLMQIDDFLTKGEGSIDISDMTPADGSELTDLDLSNQQTPADGSELTNLDLSKQQTPENLVTDVNTAKTEEAAAAEPAADPLVNTVTVQTDDTTDTQAVNTAENVPAAATDDVTEITAVPVDDAVTDEATEVTDDTTSEEIPAEETAAPAEEQTTDDRTNDLSDMSDETFETVKNTGSDTTIKTNPGQNAQNQANSNTNSNNQHNTAFYANQPTQPVVNEMRAETDVRPASYTTPVNIDTQDIMRQMATGVRTAITERISTMEMQLNPENMGKMTVRVSSEEGQVTAHINLENENVRTAMETQMGILKQNLEAQGIKVNEVTVTADAHEFERNLEEGQEASMTDTGAGSDSAFRGEEEEQRRNGRIGNIDMRTLDDSGLSNLTEDERLAAQIMKEQGNTISINA